MHFHKKEDLSFFKKVSFHLSKAGRCPLNSNTAPPLIYLLFNYHNQKERGIQTNSAIICIKFIITLDKLHRHLYSTVTQAPVKQYYERSVKMEQPMNNLTRQLFRTQSLLHRYHRQSMRGQRPGGAMRGQGRVLAILANTPPISQKELAQQLDIRQQSLSELMLRMEENGLISRSPSKEDGRVVMVELTEKGKQLADENKANLQSTEKIFDCLNDEEKEQFKNYLARITDALEDELGDDAWHGPGPHHHSGHHHGHGGGRGRGDGRGMPRHGRGGHGGKMEARHGAPRGHGRPGGRHHHAQRPCRAFG